MTSPFNWQAAKRETPKEFLPRNTKKGIIPPIVLPNSSKYLPLKDLEKAK